MSRFIKEMKSRLIEGHRHFAYGSVNNFDFTKENLGPVDMDPELFTYDIGVRYGFRINAMPRDVKRACELAVQEASEVIYGDLRELMLEMEKAIISFDHKKAMELCRKIQEEIRP